MLIDDTRISSEEEEINSNRNWEDEDTLNMSSGDSAIETSSSLPSNDNGSGIASTGLIAMITNSPTNASIAIRSITKEKDTFLSSSPSPSFISSTILPVKQLMTSTTPSVFSSSSSVPNLFSSSTPTSTFPVIFTIQDGPNDNYDDDSFRFREAERCFMLTPGMFDPVVASLCGVFLLFGLVFVLYGYRCFKATMFLVGFIFATTIVYLICLEEELLPAFGNVLIALIAGFLFGLITMLVGYVGLFMLGLHLGLLTGTASLLAMHLLAPFVPEINPPDSVWITFATIMGWGLIGACSALYFQKGCTILGTCLYGGAMIIISMDYFAENFNLLLWFWDKLREPEKSPLPVTKTFYGKDEPKNLCLISWVLIFMWPVIGIFGLMCQWCATGRGIHHSDDLLRTSSSRRNGQLDLHRIRQEDNKTDMRSRKYRYLYQVRTAHGDVISQHYIQSLQKKVCPPDQDSLKTYNSDLSHLTGMNPTESRTTTMSHLP